MPVDGPSGAPSGLRGAEFLQDLTGIRLDPASKPSGSTTVPGMGTVAVAAQPVPVRQGGQPTPVQTARSPATQSTSSIGQKILQALTAVWNFFMAPAPPAPSKVQQAQRQTPQGASAGVSAVQAGWTEAPESAQAFARGVVQAQAADRFNEFIDDGTPTGAHDNFWKDLTRANYTVQLQDGTSKRIDVKDNDGPLSHHGRMMQSIDEVTELCGGDEALMQAVTKMAHQGLVGAAQMAFMPSQPGMGMAMPDGSRGVPVYDNICEQVASYDLSAGPNPGEISIRAEYSLRGPNVALTDRGPLSLDPEGSGYTASITIAVSVGAGGVLQARVTAPLTSEYAVALARA